MRRGQMAHQAAGAYQKRATGQRYGGACNARQIVFRFGIAHDRAIRYTRMGFKSFTQRVWISSDLAQANQHGFETDNLQHGGKGSRARTRLVFPYFGILQRHAFHEQLSIDHRAAHGREGRDKDRGTRKLRRGDEFAHKGSAQGGIDLLVEQRWSQLQQTLQQCKMNRRRIGRRQAPAVSVDSHHVKTVGFRFRIKLHKGAQTRLHTSCSTVGSARQIVSDNKHFHDQHI